MATTRMNGVRAEYRQTGNGPDLLLLHSLLTEMSVFERVLPRLAQAHRVTCLNLPGFGASDPVELSSVGEHADHVVRAMDALSLPSIVDVFGNGFGAFVALELAIRHGARMGRLMVADTVPAFPEPAKAPFRGMAEKVRATGISAILTPQSDACFRPRFRRLTPKSWPHARPRLHRQTPYVLRAPAWHWRRSICGRNWRVFVTRRWSCVVCSIRRRRRPLPGK